MKKLLVISLLLGSLVLSGCIKQNGLSQSELFEKKKECASYKDEITQKIKAYDDEIRKIEKGRGILMEHERSLGELFYSPIKNSCLYSVHAIEKSDGNICDRYNIKDVFNEAYADGIIIRDENSICDSSKSFIAYKEKLKELKGE